MVLDVRSPNERLVQDWGELTIRELMQRSLRERLRFWNDASGVIAPTCDARLENSRRAGVKVEEAYNDLMLVFAGDKSLEIQETVGLCLSQLASGLRFGLNMFSKNGQPNDEIFGPIKKEAIPHLFPLLQIRDKLDLTEEEQVELDVHLDGLKLVLHQL